jgi:hypothetical protein
METVSGFQQFIREKPCLKMSPRNPAGLFWQSELAAPDKEWNRDLNTN